MTGDRNHEANGAKARRSTIRDVAAQAGVSVATVSRVLAGSHPVSEQLRAKVLRVVREVDYVTNAHAKSLAGAGQLSIAMLIGDITGASFAHAAKGVEQEAASRGSLTLVGSTDLDPAREAAMVNLMREQGAGAVILIGGASDLAEHQQRMARYAKSLNAAGSHLVLCGRPPLPPEVPAITVDYDNEGGAFAMTSHLLSAGHRRILILPGVEGYTTASIRLAGYTRALEAYGMSVEPDLVVHTTYEYGEGARAVRQALERGVEFTAVFAGSDVVAAGALEALRSAGLRVPEDVSLAGYDDIPLARDLTPKLTTVHVPYEEIGRSAARLALEREPGVRGEHKHVVLGTHVVVRQSVAPPPR
ncbi:LacI family DNA-binding transcriptional regulator [Actinospica sp. MGRD01-02]|uniref:LacI family DNA-binding transcriptional regulator n=1 Tax=Actinospica acidithermotolerans TaxID=2828514 RepID=A0A941EGX5_9ACTN|nr:LacI family DNA-binding transcriptional regulator [Actinospica acidithermotolerans]MBR7828864.1 LacI family DNA-binding transcriptional regulator [Actinospica acidithermotolerans]